MYASVIIPTLNEEGHIGSLLEQLISQEPTRVLDLLVADGGSTDRTREIVTNYSRRDQRVRLIDNPRRIQSSGINLAAACADARSTIIIRIDAHAGYPPDYVSALLAEMEQRDCESVVVRLRTVGKSCFQFAVATVCNSNVGTGGSAHRVGGVPRFVDHGHHAAFKRAAFDGVGGYDPTFAANEDAEFDLRLRAAGGRVWFASNIVVDYVPRSSTVKLARQYHGYGIGRARNFRKNGGLRLRQLVPPMFLLCLFASMVLAFIFPPLLVLPLAYLCLVAGASVMLWRKSARRCALASVVIIPTIHLSWASGFWRGLLTSGIRYQTAHVLEK
jgi:succinoglycan biosynthesis protein ExoA